MKTLVTGGAGFIGSHLVDKLLAAGHQVAVVDNLSTGKYDNIVHNESKSNFVFYKKDITEDLSEVFVVERPEVVFHLAALPRVQRSIDEPRETHHVNINGTFNMLQLARHFKVKRFVFASSSSVYGDQDELPLHEGMKVNPMSPYALQKYVGEHYCRQFNMIYGLKTVALRFFNVYGSRLDPEGGYACLVPKFIRLFKNGEQPTINGTGEQTRDFTFIDDVIEAIKKAGLSKEEEMVGEVINIGAHRNMSVNEITNAIKKLVKSDLNPIYGPAVIEPKDTYANINKAKKLLDWEPKIGVDEGLRRTYEWLK